MSEPRPITASLAMLRLARAINEQSRFNAHVLRLLARVSNGGALSAEDIDELAEIQNQINAFNITIITAVEQAGG